VFAVVLTGYLLGFLAVTASGSASPTGTTPTTEATPPTGTTPTTEAKPPAGEVPTAARSPYYAPVPPPRC
jgi:hypothetical protein